MKKLVFDKDFIFGSATASYQIEGAYKEDGRGMSIWDDFSRIEGKTFNGDNGDIACDSYHRYKEDVAILKKIGFKSYRFSIAWPRIFPNGTGEVNIKGVEYYHNLLKELKANDIVPYVTLYHWDLPSSLGDWRDRNVAYAFKDYATFCFEEYKNEVENWITINEPLCISFVSHYWGEHAPGHKSLSETFDVAHNVNLAHGLAVKAFRDGNYKGKIGTTLNLVYSPAASDRSEDIKAAKLSKAIMSDIFTYPIFKGYYPKEIKEDYNYDLKIEDGDLELISQKIDFLGLNYYNESLVTYDENEELKFKTVESWQDTTEMDWPIVPEGLMRFLEAIHKDSNGIDLIITENGIAVDDRLNSNGRVHDIKRINYIKDHLEICKEAIEKGIPLKGYFAWSLMDNFEWAKGYSKRFGLTYVDYENNCKRTIKDSGYFLRDVMLGLV